MQGQTLKILFLSQRNSARSVMVAAELLEHAGVEVPDHPPQHVREFSGPQAPPLDFVFTLSDTAAGEAPPSWPGHPITAHWRCTDPDQYDDPTERRLALMRTRAELERRIRVLTNLPMASLDRLSLQAEVEALGGGERR
jgi:arsenate reductase